jgi:hypothetical protein
MLFLIDTSPVYCIVYDKLLDIIDVLTFSVKSRSDAAESLTALTTPGIAINTAMTDNITKYTLNLDFIKNLLHPEGNQT